MRIKISRCLLLTCAIVQGGMCALLAQEGDSNEELTQDSGFTRYQSILDRMPFGEVPPNYDPTLPPGSASASAADAAAAEGAMTEAARTEEQQKIAASVRVSVLNVTPSGQMMVGFTDTSAQPPEHHYLPVGVRRDGWLVKSVDTAEPEKEKITLEKDGIEVTVTLGEGPQEGDKKGGRRPAAGQHRPGTLAARPRLANVPPAAANTPVAGGEGGALGRLRARRQQQQHEEAKRRAAAAEEEKVARERRAAEEAERAAAAEQAAAERQQQREALMQIQEELRRQREEKNAAREQDGAGSEE